MLKLGTWATEEAGTKPFVSQGGPLQAKREMEGFPDKSICHSGPSGICVCVLGREGGRCRKVSAYVNMTDKSLFPLSLWAVSPQTNRLVPSSLC